VLVNLDQCGQSDVRLHTIQDILVSFSAAEIFCTFAIKSLMAFLRKSNSVLRGHRGRRRHRCGSQASLHHRTAKASWYLRISASARSISRVALIPATNLSAGLTNAALPAGGKKNRDAACHVRADLGAQRLELLAEQRSHRQGQQDQVLE
jgi:hypothetical protein